MLHGFVKLLGKTFQLIYIRMVSGFLWAFFNRKACITLKYEPEAFKFNIKMTLNNYIYYENEIEGRNPEPLCYSPPILQDLKICSRFYDLYFVGSNMNICFDITGDYKKKEIFHGLVTWVSFLEKKNFPSKKGKIMCSIGFYSWSIQIIWISTWSNPMHFQFDWFGNMKHEKWSKIVLWKERCIHSMLLFDVTQTFDRITQFVFASLLRE